MLAIMSGAVGAMVLGPVGIAVAPAVMAYNAVTGKKSPVRSAAGSVLETFVAKPMAAIAGFVANVAPDVKGARDAQRYKQVLEERQEAVKQEKVGLDSVKQKDVHSQNVDITLLAVQNQHQAPVKLAQKRTKWQDKIRNVPKTVKDKFTDMVSKKPSKDTVIVGRTQ